MHLSSIDHLFDPEQFRTSGHALVDLLAEHLKSQLDGTATLTQWQAPYEAELIWQQDMPEHADMHHDELANWLKKTVLPRGLAMHHPHSMAHQAAAPLPVAALCDMVSALSNQAMVVYETGPAATMMERQVIGWLNNMIGWQQGTGILTSGGSQANLTALLAARQQAHAGIWRNGSAVMPNLRILTSTLSHYSISRAAGIMGLGTDAIIPIEVDDQGRMRMQALQEAHKACLHNNMQVMAIVAAAGCTQTGSIDPLQAIGEYCRSHNLWLHIDGAHGASALLSNQYSSLLQGIPMADSVTWDGHKLLYMPAPISAVLFRQSDPAKKTFSQEASYLFQGNDDFNTSYRTLECTKHMMALKLTVAFKLYGRQGMAKLVEHVFATAVQFARMITQTSDFALLMHPQTNIVCFRYHGDITETVTPDQLNALQANIRTELLHQALFHLSQVEIDGNIWLRCTFMNPYTEQRHLQQLLEVIATMAKRIINNCYYKHQK